VEDYLSEKEQIAQLRGVVRENAPWAVAGVLIGVALLVGWQQWQAWRERQAAAAGAKYSQTLEALGRADREAATRLTTQLRQDYARTPYADLAALALARYYVDVGRPGEAAPYLEAVMRDSRDEELRVVARLRLARAQRADGKPDLALATLAQGKPGPAAAAYAEVRGDVLRDKGDRAGAVAAYQQALADTTAGLVNRERVELELAALGGSGAKP
jgi:predicted negative regulator of RcsB-dependent stress response